MPANIRSQFINADGNELRSAPAKTQNHPIELDSPPSSNLCSCLNPQNSLAQDFINFKRSGDPSRFLFFRDGSWTDFARQVFDDLKAGFATGKTALEIVVDGDLYLFDFLRMLQIDLSTGAQNSIAWIDVAGRCFFPRAAVDDQTISNSSSVVSSNYDSLKGKRDFLDCPEDCSVESSSNVDSYQKKWPHVYTLKDGDRGYKVVGNLFLAGIRISAPDTVITSISKCSYSGPAGNSRLKAFQMQMQMTKAARGDPNVKVGWYGAPAQSIAGVLAHGFELPNNKILGSDDYGVGIHLSPPEFSAASSVLSEADCNGERHVILCRVITGKPERIPAGSLQSRPSNEQFDIGVDDLAKPRWYIVWSNHKNTHILPEYVVSFKSSKQQQGPWRMTSPAKKNLSFTKLFAEIMRTLPSSKIQALNIQYNQYKVGKISKNMFIRYIRTTVGDDLLTSTIIRIRGLMK